MLRRVLACIAFRWLCFAVMTVLAVWNEGRPGRAIADPFLALFPYVPWVERWNYVLWIAAWLPGVVALLVLSRPRFCRRTRPPTTEAIDRRSRSSSTKSGGIDIPRRSSPLLHIRRRQTREIHRVRNTTPYSPRRARPRARKARSHPSFCFTSGPTLPKSICPAWRSFRCAITRPMSFTLAAPVAAMASAMAAVVSASLSPFGR